MGPDHVEEIEPVDDLRLGVADDDLYYKTFKLTDEKRDQLCGEVRLQPTEVGDRGGPESILLR